MKLIPMPSLFRKTQEKILNKKITIGDMDLDPRLMKAIQKLPIDSNGLPLYIHIGKDYGENYTLDLSNDGIMITAPSVVGAFYGIQTLRQLMENKTVYVCHIEDAPDFGFRGFYHDVTRGRIPTLDTLKELVDYMAYMKLNSLQLYVEHTFAFREFADSVEKTGCLTAEEIRELDDYCYENFIELIPSMSSFGHLYVLLEMPQYQHLQVAKDYENTHIYWYERMAHHTIDPLHPESFPLIKSMIDQFVPLFRSDKFNICCDETFDLKNGKHQDMDTGELYIAFTNKLINYLKSYGKQVMMWGDILHEHPDRVKDIPKDVTLLNWYYEADVEQAEKRIRVFHDLDRIQIACPGTYAWNHFCESLFISIPNITNMTKLAKTYNAKGILNTNWGDYGDPCSFDMSLFGIAYGAARSWNVSAEVEDVIPSADYLIYRHSGTLDILYALSIIERTVHYGEFAWMYNNLYYPEKLHFDAPKEAALRSARNQSLGICEKLELQSWERDAFRQEIMIAAEGVAVMAEMMMKLLDYAVSRRTDTEKWLVKYRTSWLKKNKESELREIETMFRILEAAILQGKVLCITK